MAKKLSATFVNLVYDATLKSFWRHKTLKRILQQHGIKASFLATWSSEETKREFLDRLFVQLPQMESCDAFLTSLARDLAEQTIFPDLRGFEETDRMTAEALLAVEALRHALGQVDSEVVLDRERRAAQERVRRLHEEAARSRATLSKLDDRLRDLSKSLGTQKAGYDFQNWFFDLMDFYEIVNRRPYNVGGRQVDGSITIEGTTYLVELKFTTDQASATDVDIFERKVTGKADNTMGVMVSISGYSSTATAEASRPGTPLLLLDHGHIYLALGGAMAFGEIVARARRHASQTGEAYLAASQIGQ